MGKDSRDTLRRIQRQLRDHYSALAEELSRSNAEALAARHATAPSAPQTEREPRLQDLGRRTGPAAPAAGRGPTARAGGSRDEPRSSGPAGAAGPGASTSTAAPGTTPGWPSVARPPRRAAAGGHRRQGQGRASRRCSTRWSANGSPRPTRASAPASSPGTGTGPPTGSTAAPARRASRGSCRFHRDDGAIEVDLGGAARPTTSTSSSSTWPSQALRTATLIDTPGIGSLSEQVSAAGLGSAGGRRRGDPGRRGALPDAPPARQRPRVPARRSTTPRCPGPTRSTRSACCRGPTRSASAGSTRWPRPGGSPPGWPPTPTCAGSCRPWSRWPACWPRRR